jgi:hypothetical protein
MKKKSKNLETELMELMSMMVGHGLFHMSGKMATRVTVFCWSNQPNQMGDAIWAIFHPDGKVVIQWYPDYKQNMEIDRHELKDGETMTGYIKQILDARSAS